MKTRVLIIIILAIISSGLSLGQKSSKKVVITGIVTDANQKPLSGAMIFIDNAKTNVISDNKGSYRIKVNRNAVSIAVFSPTNGLNQTKIDGRTVINFTMKAAPLTNVNGLSGNPNDETVHIGYGTIKKKDLTTSVGMIDGTNKKYASYKDIYEMIQGEVPGVQVNGKSILIRGPSSILLSNEPLYVVDGVVTQSIDDIPPSSVRSIEVLKGASASIYGSRGANGVILIYILTGNDKK